MKKTIHSQTVPLEQFTKVCGHYSPFAVLVGIILSFVFCGMVDFTVFSSVFENVLYGSVGIFCALFILIVRGALLVHGLQNFRNGHNFAGFLSSLMQIGAVVWVCYEAPKAAELFGSSVVKKDAAINFIRFIAIAATLLEVLLILQVISNKDVSDGDDEAEEDLQIAKEKEQFTKPKFVATPPPLFSNNFGKPMVVPQ
jgi:hypothetical protein